MNGPTMISDPRTFHNQYVPAPKFVEIPLARASSPIRSDNLWNQTIAPILQVSGAIRKINNQ